ncbi:MAG: HTH domain-containing protein [Dehalococcoidia bacterium]
MRTYVRSQRRRNEPAIDGLPEQTHYADTGCEASGSCFNCPLPQCKYDNPAWYQEYRRRGRDMEVLAAYQEEQLSVFQVAQRFNVSPRTVHRAIQRAMSPMAMSA